MGIKARRWEHRIHRAKVAFESVNAGKDKLEVLQWANILLSFHTSMKDKPEETYFTSVIKELTFSTDTVPFKKAS